MFSVVQKDITPNQDLQSVFSVYFSDTVHQLLEEVGKHELFGYFFEGIHSFVKHLINLVFFFEVLRTKFEEIDAIVNFTLVETSWILVEIEFSFANFKIVSDY